MRGRQNQAMGLGLFVRERRNELGLSLRQAADEWDINKSELSRIESNERRNPTGHILFKLARGLGITVDELLSTTDFGTPADSLPEVSPSRASTGRRGSGKPTATI